MSGFHKQCLDSSFSDAQNEEYVELLNKLQLLEESTDAQYREASDEALDNNLKKLKESIAIKQPEIYVRVRPLNEEETKESVNAIDGIALNTTVNKNERNVSGISTDNKTIGNFNGVFGTDSTNAQVFENSLKNHIPKILDGGSVSLFCYGHTGTGKTHSMLGYNEHGLFQLGAEQLTSSLTTLNQQCHSNEDSGDKLTLQVKFAEIYLDKVYDLIGGRTECTLREDIYGQLHIKASHTEVSTEDGRVIPGQQNSSVANTMDEILTILEDGIKLRAVGTSSLHDQSSRSHAVMELEVVNQSLIQARKEVLYRDSVIHPIGKKKTDTAIALITSLLDVDQNKNEDGSAKGPGTGTTGWTITRKCDDNEIRAATMTTNEWMDLYRQLVTESLELYEALKIAEEV